MLTPDEIPTLPVTHDSAAAAAPASPVAADASPTVGPYHLLRVLGEGGFGVVYLAERREPFVQAVALKVLRAGMDTPSLVARFELERQALALMDHPNVARVLDGGLTDATSRLGRARPYFAMELVAGRPINEFCREGGEGGGGLDIRATLELFIPVCEAVQHAHSKGVVHRDLKPSNILVAPAAAGEEPVVKVIDFGVAKALAGSSLHTRTMTGEGHFIGTPEYMSPEQAGAGEAGDVDTRTDVYSLGVVLYELLTGVLPFEKDQLWRGHVLDMMRVIREVDPPRPSDRIVATNPALARRLRGDLDWIVVRAMEKSRDRRYEGPGALAADIRRHLRTEPVEAGPPSATYRTGKFVRRHRPLVLAGGLSALAVVGGLVAAVYGLREAQTQRDAAIDAGFAERQERVRAESSNEFMLGAIWNAQPMADNPEELTVRALVNAMAAKLDAGVMDKDVSARANVRLLMGEIYRLLGEPDQAAEQLTRLLTELDTNDAGFGLRHDKALIELAKVHADKREPGRVLERLDAVSAALGDSSDPEARLLLGHALLTRGRALMELRRADEAEAALREARSLFENARGRDAMALVNTLMNLAVLASARPGGGRRDEALDLAQQAFELSETEYGESDPLSQIALAAVARVQRDRGDLTAAIASYTRALSAAEELKTTPRLHLATIQVNLAQTLNEDGQPAEAQEMAAAALATRRELAPGSPLLSETLAIAASIAAERGDGPAAEALWREDLDIARGPRGGGALAAARALSGVADALNLQGRFSEAAPLAGEALETRSAGLAPGDWRVDSTRSVLGAAKAGLGEFEEAERLLLDSVTHLQEAKAAPARLRPVYRRVLGLYERWGRAEEAARWRAELAELPGPAL